MTWPDKITIKRETGTTTEDSESGQSVGKQDFKVIYGGGSRLQQDEYRIDRMLTGDEKLVDYTFAFLPPGDHGIFENDLITADSHSGRVKRIQHFRRQHYTRLLVKWDGA